MKEAGVERYHANLETSRRYFPQMCTTHTYEDKVANIQRARAAGLEVCSGGILGMGESWEDRLDLAVSLAELEITSIPLNLLRPIPGTPYEGMEPISFTNLAIYLALYLLGWKRGTVSYLVYVLIGMVGVPVFSGFTGGMGKLLGPTGGYIVGFIPMALIAGVVIDRFRSRGIQLAGMVVGTAVCYAFGTAWYCFQASSPVGAALGLCVFPFIPGDLVKMLIAMALGPVIRSRLEKAGLYQG